MQNLQLKEGFGLSLKDANFWLLIQFLLGLIVVGIILNDSRLIFVFGY